VWNLVVQRAPEIPERRFPDSAQIPDALLHVPEALFERCKMVVNNGYGSRISLSHSVSTRCRPGTAPWRAAEIPDHGLSDLPQFLDPLLHVTKTPLQRFDA
jgi:hypothetical protein